VRRCSVLGLLVEHLFIAARFHHFDDGGPLADGFGHPGLPGGDFLALGDHLFRPGFGDDDGAGPVGDDVIAGMDLDAGELDFLVHAVLDHPAPGGDGFHGAGCPRRAWYHRDSGDPGWWLCRAGGGTTDPQCTGGISYAGHHLPGDRRSTSRWARSRPVGRAIEPDQPGI